MQTFDPGTGTANLVIRGGCPDCDVSPATFIHGIEVQLKLRISELKAVFVTIEPAG